MPEIIYTGSHDAVDVPTGGRAERDGDPVEVSDEVAKALVQRDDFKPARKGTKKED